MIALLIAAMLVNWYVTTVLIESHFLHPVRRWVRHNIPIRPKGPEPQTVKEAAKRATERYLDDNGGWRRRPAQRRLYVGLEYLFGCYLCLGFWVAIAEVLWLHSIVGAGLLGFLFTAFLIKAGGHLILELRPQSWYRHR